MVGRNGSLRGRGGGGHENFGREPHYGICKSFCLGFDDPYAKAMVMVESGANVPAIDGMGSPPGFTGGWFLMLKAAGAK